MTLRGFAVGNTELFTGKAAAYAKARPTYPAAAIQYIQAQMPQDAVIAEIGAGTGKLTLPLAQLGFRILAVEPNADMRAELFKTVSAFTRVSVLAATAEETKLPDHCVDAIICAQALHWFDLDIFRKECCRIGKPDAVVIVVYNNTPGGESTSHSKTSTESFFRNPTIKEFSNPVCYTREDWLAYMTSHSHDPLPGSDEYQAHMENMNQIFDAESADGILTKSLTTCVYSEKASELF